MLQNKTIFSRNLPEKTLVLTFDDGPGPDTLKLAEYLANEGVLSGFFMLGKNVVEMPDIVRKVYTLGHLIGNHSYNHRNLNKLRPSEAAEDILAGEGAIRGILGIDTNIDILFRAPYGDWHNSIGWDIPRYTDNADWFYWKCGWEPKKAAHILIDEIIFRNKGIVCLHDNDHSGGENHTFDMMKILIPQLKAKGYNFIRLDEAL